MNCKLCDSELTKRVAPKSLFNYDATTLLCKQNKYNTPHYAATNPLYSTANFVEWFVFDEFACAVFKNRSAIYKCYKNNNLELLMNVDFVLSFSNDLEDKIRKYLIFK